MAGPLPLRLRELDGLAAVTRIQPNGSTPVADREMAPIRRKGLEYAAPLYGTEKTGGRPTVPSSPADEPPACLRFRGFWLRRRTPSSESRGYRDVRGSGAWTPRRGGSCCTLWRQRPVTTAEYCEEDHGAHPGSDPPTPPAPGGERRHGCGEGLLEFAEPAGVALPPRRNSR